MTGNWLISGAVLVLLIHVGMGLRTALLLRQQGTPRLTAWLAGLLAWPLVRRIAADADEDDAPRP